MSGYLIVVAACLVSSKPAVAQESWAVGGFFGPGIPALSAGVSVTAPLSRTFAIDASVSRIGLGLDSSSDISPAVTAVVRWMRGGRAESGSGRYWIVGALGFQEKESALLIFPGNVRQQFVTTHTYVVPRFGYGWDHVTRHGVRAGIDVTAGAAGEAVGLVFANVFVMWGPPRK